METERGMRAVRRRSAGIAALALALLAAGTAAVPAAASGGSSGVPFEDAPRQRTRRWWLDTWSHSMQEKLFVQWMNAQNGGTGWQFTMTPSQVNAVYAWWLQAVWPNL